MARTCRHAAPRGHVQVLAACCPALVAAVPAASAGLHVAPPGPCQPAPGVVLLLVRATLLGALLLAQLLMLPGALSGCCASLAAILATVRKARKVLGVLLVVRLVAVGGGSRLMQATATQRCANSCPGWLGGRIALKGDVLLDERGFTARSRLQGHRSGREKPWTRTARPGRQHTPAHRSTLLFVSLLNLLALAVTVILLLVAIAQQIAVLP
jgi:hypothetical protein